MIILNISIAVMEIIIDYAENHLMGYKKNSMYKCFSRFAQD